MEMDDKLQALLDALEKQKQAEKQTEKQACDPAAKAASPQRPPEHNNYPCAADCVAADVLAAGLDGQVSRDVMARKGAGLKKYGTALKPCNGRDNLMDLYQELIDGAKYAKTEILQRQILGLDYSPELVEVYAGCIKLLDSVYCLMNGKKTDGAQSCEGDTPFRKGPPQVP